jgi:pimeloyl-ACP methyl ester carboxylesterase
MKRILMVGAMLVSLCAGVQAQECKSQAEYAKAREVIKDLGRILTPSGVQESYKTRIGGIDQWLNVRGQDKDNPVILFIHGGPASPLIPAIWQFQRPLEEYFTIVNYDQRAAGKTFNETPPDSISDTIHIPRYIDDAIEIAEHIKARYHKNKVILMGHSWGTVIGMGAALKRPDLFYAYVGIGQVISTQVNERVSFDFAVEQAKKNNNEKALKELASIAPYPGDQPLTRERIITARIWAQNYGGLTAYRDSSDYFYDAGKLSPEYNDCDVRAIDEGNMFSLGRLLPEFLNVDYRGVKKFPIPVVMFMGRHDFTTPSVPTAEWLKQVQAPYKRGVWFEHASHMIPWEEPGKTLVSLLETVRPLATKSK